MSWDYSAIFPTLRGRSLFPSFARTSTHIVAQPIAKDNILDENNWVRIKRWVIRRLSGYGQRQVDA